MDIKLTFKDGTVKEFKHEGRPGGSYTKSIKYEGAFVIVKDEWDKTWAYPAEDVKEVQTNSGRGYW